MKQDSHVFSLCDKRIEFMPTNNPERTTIRTLINIVDISIFQKS